MNQQTIIYLRDAIGRHITGILDMFYQQRQIDMNAINFVQNSWSQDHLTIVNQVIQKYGVQLTDTTAQSVARNVIAQILERYSAIQQQQSMYPQYQQQPYYQQQYVNQAPVAAPYGAPQQQSLFDSLNSNVYGTQSTLNPAPPVQNGNIYAGTAPASTAPVQQEQPPTQEEPMPIQHFAPPVVDQVNPSSDHAASQGACKFHISHVLDGGDGHAIDIARATIDHRSFSSPRSVVEYLNKTVMLELASQYYVQVQYASVAAIPVPRPIMAQVLAELTTKWKDREGASIVSYIDQMIGVLNNHTRGISEAIEGFLLGFINAATRAGALMSSDENYRGQYCFNINSLVALRELLGSESSNPDIQRIKTLPGLRNALLTIFHDGLADMLDVMEVLDPTNPEHIDDYVIALDTMPDIADLKVQHILADARTATKQKTVAAKEAEELIKKRTDQCNEQVSVIRIPERTLLYTSLALPYRINVNDPTNTKALCVSYGEAEGHDSNLEYITTSNSLGDHLASNVIMKMSPGIELQITATLTTDGWLRFAINN